MRRFGGAKRGKREGPQSAAGAGGRRTRKRAGLLALLAACVGVEMGPKSESSTPDVSFRRFSSDRGGGCRRKHGFLSLGRLCARMPAPALPCAPRRRPAHSPSSYTTPEIRRCAKSSPPALPTRQGGTSQYRPFSPNKQAQRAIMLSSSTKGSLALRAARRFATRNACRAFSSAPLEDDYSAGFSLKLTDEQVCSRSPCATPSQYARATTTGGC